MMDASCSLPFIVQVYIVLINSWLVYKVADRELENNIWKSYIGYTFSNLFVNKIHGINNFKPKFE